ncbi:hypothetical protein ISG33_07905 [Glaciecola sp. MH2013]|uniref:hypothetical protein n=1 Tax=Glaciecola sp. MH2013 TaxID=2785524 RepID=UPI00189EEB0A|nr:hypothetical protein [Glaciecola sp. MH2013]MBF7073318.1 hypothetical protein [Glaciecola sp. MH2013]
MKTITLLIFILAQISTVSQSFSNTDASESEDYRKDSKDVNLRYLQLSTAIESDSMKLAIELLSQGISANETLYSVSIINETVVGDCKLPFLELLLKNGANVNVKNNIDGTHPIH